MLYNIILHNINITFICIVPLGMERNGMTSEISPKAIAPEEWLRILHLDRVSSKRYFLLQVSMADLENKDNT